MAYSILKGRAAGEGNPFVNIVNTLHQQVKNGNDEEVEPPVFNRSSGWLYPSKK